MEKVKIALFSDSHDNIKNLKNAVEISNSRECTHLFHLGDIVSPPAVKTLKKFQGEITAVFGNCDEDLIELQKVFRSIGGVIFKPPHKKILVDKLYVLMHEPYLLEEMIQSGEPDFIFFGHSHECHFRRKGKTVIINPGEIAGIKNEPVFYILDIANDNFEKIKL